jgi:hypothetical protein
LLACAFNNLSSIPQFLPIDIDIDIDIDKVRQMAHLAAPKPPGPALE